ncbi:hypothetical protein JW921_10920, partial [Candidatus Fermentibacterales bacterium]|nr:hypothetical protein [Candidatus Fermentibacterales bacterium]
MTRSRAEESLLPLALSLAAIEVGAFLVPPWSLPIPVLLMIPAGVLLWGPRWLVGSLLLASAPLFLVLFCLLVSGHAQAMAAARLALCVIAASFHLRLAGTDRIARAIRSVAARAGVARELLETLAEVLEEGAETARRAGAMVGSIRRSGRSVGLQEVADMVLSAFLG